MLQLDARLGEIWGFSPLIIVMGHFYEIRIAALLLRVKPRHVEKFRKFRFADVGKSELGKNKKQTCATHTGWAKKGDTSRTMQCNVREVSLFWPTL